MTLLIALLSLARADDSAVVASVHRALIARDGVSCDAIQLMGPADVVRDALIAEVTAPNPPAAPMRAASCVAEHAEHDPIAWAAVQRWMADPKTPGLALEILAKIDAMPEDHAIEIARIAVGRMPNEPRFAAYARPKIVESTHPTVRALAP